MAGRFVLVFGLSLAGTQTSVLATDAAAITDQWPVFRHDAQLTGRSSLVGRIRRPRVVGEYLLGAWQGWLVARPAVQAHAIVLTQPGEGDVESLKQRFGLGPPLYDLRGDGHLVAVPQTTGQQIGKILPNSPGLQAVRFDDAFGYRGNERGHLYAYEPGSDEPREVWITPPEPDMFMPLVLLLDADGDGNLEAVVATQYRVMVFDARTGHKDAELRIHRYRNYGFFGAEDLDHDGRPEFVIIADFSSHVDVVDYEDAKLRLLWRRDIDPDLEVRKKAVRVGPDPIVDIDGDGRWELVFNLFNDTGDEQWHLVAYDALTGQLKWDLQQRFMVGQTRLGSSPAPCLLTVDTYGSPLPRWGTLRVLRLRGGNVAQVWCTTRAQWETWDVPVLPPTRSTGATLGRRTALVNEAASVLYVRRPIGEDQTALCAVAWKRGKLREQWRVVGPNLHALASCDTDGDGQPEALLKLQSHSPTVQIRGVRATIDLIAMRSAGARPTSPVAADLDGDGRLEIVVNDDARGILALAVHPDRRQTRLRLAQLWRAPGRGMADSRSQWYGVQVADVDGDEAPEVLVADSNDRGEAELVVLNGAGRPEWRKAFPQIDGSDPIWNRGCLTYWSVLNAGEKGAAIYVSVRRNLMHSDESMLLRGRDGQVLWHQRKVKCPHAVRAVGGKMVAAVDVNDDGYDDIVIAYPDVLLVLDGQDGKPLVAHPTTGDDMPGWVAYAVPVVLDADGDGRLEIFWTACTYTTAAFDPQGNVLWHTGYRDGRGVQNCWTMPAFADMRDDGRVELVGAGYEDGLHVYDGASGELLGSLAMPAPTGPAASTDINGDGLEEAIVPAGDSLWAVHMPRGELRVAWRVALPATPFAPIVADLDGDGCAEIAVVCADGFLRIVDG